MDAALTSLGLAPFITGQLTPAQFQRNQVARVMEVQLMHEPGFAESEVPGAT